MHIVSPVFADVRFDNPDLNPVAKFSSISSFTNIIVPLLMIVGGFITLTMLLYGAFMFLTSEGEPDKIKKSQATLMYAVMGLFLIVASFIITKIIGVIFNVKMPL